MNEETGLTHQTNLHVVIVKTQHDQDSIDKVNAIQRNLLHVSLI